MTPYTDEHDQLRASVRGLVRTDRSRARENTGHDVTLWRRMCDELGVAGLAIPEVQGGAGFGVVELAVVAEEVGRANLPSPFLTTAVAGLALAAAGEDVGAIARGERLATVSFSPDGRHVPDGDVADVLVLVDVTGASVEVVELGGVPRTALTTMDLTRGQAHLDLRGAPRREIDVPAHRVAALAATLLACEQIGGAERVLETSTAYASQRVQFGRPVGSFQAVKHLLADMLVDLELARSAQQHAVALAADTGTSAPVLDAASRTARAACSRAFTRISSDGIRVHGGIGYTWEHDAHLYFRRARASAVLFTPGDDADRLAAYAGLAS
ncbi:acyl-CoA dehydrogenase family protein [Actinomycetospora sp. NBRC 106378]|uniref:acyl-CoA dehydrogenase family protein n=1 Tax=Actinomycetospora sp. NBRC 106378 TaxID=3032208 RepID=UPI0024A2BA3C|nr:acyl-CoA dehydrogenase family protein [Actinomycetospora sp. NBRC 106378]GLZ55594.1 acyl-CoA dehydrogenase [Actinomycetospora sp. NBRC 106378]